MTVQFNIGTADSFLFGIANFSGFDEKGKEFKVFSIGIFILSVEFIKYTKGKNFQTT